MMDLATQLSQNDTTKKNRRRDIKTDPKDDHSGDKTIPTWPELHDRKQAQQMSGDGSKKHNFSPERLVLPKIRPDPSNERRKEARSPVRFPPINANSNLEEQGTSRKAHRGTKEKRSSGTWHRNQEADVSGWKKVT
ncbi:uncharacterized protein LOC144775634 [Lissotriton helveticus]